MHARRLLVLLSLVATFLVVSPTSSGEASTRNAVRIAGADRYATAASISRAVFAAGAPSVVIASGEAFPDGLVAGPLAALVKGPVLLTGRDALPDATATELRRLDVDQAIVVGGPAAVSGPVFDAIASAAGVSTERVAAADRYGTAAAVAERFPAGSPWLLLATGDNFPDALAAGAAASVSAVPLLLTARDALPPATAAEINRLAPPEVIVVGGPGVVSDAAATSAGNALRSVRRVFGPDRYATAAALAADRLPHARQVVMATGLGFADALASSSLARQLVGPLLLTDPGCVPPATVFALQVLGWPDVTAVGGDVAVSSAVLSVLPCVPVVDGDVAPGVRLDTHFLPGPRVAKVLTVNRNEGVEVVTATGNGRLAGFLRTTETSRRHNAVAAVNGDFFIPSNGRPVHAFAMGGRLLKAPGLTEAMVALDSGRFDLAFSGTPQPDVRLLVDGTSLTLPVHRLNDGFPDPGQVIVMTPEAGDRFEGGPWCAAGLRPIAPPAIHEFGNTFQTFTMEPPSCGQSAIATSEGLDLVAAYEGTPEATIIEELEVGAQVTLTWRLLDPWVGVRDAMGANMTLVRNGAISTDVIDRPEAFFRERAPRTAMGILGDGRILLVTVDGRRAGYSIGMTPRELADFMLSLGAVEAANLDGGGSTAMAVGGILANRPSEPSGERAVGPVLMVVRR